MEVVNSWLENHHMKLPTSSLSCHFLTIKSQKLEVVVASLRISNFRYSFQSAASTAFSGGSTSTNFNQCFEIVGLELNPNSHR